MVIKKLLNFISGIGTPAAAFYLLRGYWQFRTWNRLLVAAFAGALLLYLLTGGLAFFVVTFTVYFFNLDMKLTSMIEPFLLKWYDRIPRNQHL